MPALASFIDRVRPGRKPKTTPRSTQPDLNPYASPDVVYIGDQSYDAPEDPRATISFDSTAKESVTASTSTDISTPKASIDSTSTAGTSLTPTRSRSPLSRTNSRSPSPSPSPPPSPRRVTPPRMKLSIDFSQDSLDSWIPSHLLDSGVYGASGSVRAAATSTSNVSGMSGSTGFASANGRSGNFNGLRPDTSSHLSRDTTGVAIDVQTVNEDASLYDDDDDEEEEGNLGPVDDEDSTEVVVAKLQGMDASTFLNTPQSNLQGSRTSPPKRTAPSPIKIPRTTPKIQVIRSSVQSATDQKPDHPPSSYPQSQPHQSSTNQHQTSYDFSDPYSYDSATNSASASAVSGTTLARALIGNTFVLSSDERASRYRSGGSALTRSDSATLPRGEREYWNHSSPASASTHGHWSYGIFYSGENRKSITSDSASPMDREPMPANADAVYSPPKNPRRVGVDEASGSGSRKRLSTGSMGDDHHKPSEEGISRSKSATAAVNLGAGLSNSHRISPISESSPSNSVNGVETSQTPPPPVPHPPSTVHNSSASQDGPPRPSRAPPLPPIPPIPPTSGRSSPNRSSYTASMSGGGPSTGRSSDFDLEYYQYPRTPDPTSGGAFDPYLENQDQEQSEAGSSSSSATAVGSSAGVNTVGAVGVSVAAIPPGSQYRPVFSPISEESTLASGTTTPSSALSTPLSEGQFSVGRNSSGGRNHPAGKRDSKPVGSKLGAIGENQATSSANEGTSLQTPLLPPPPISNVFNRQRSGSAPAPIRVVRDSRDPRQYNILVGSSPIDEPHPRAEGSHQRTAGSESTPTTGGSGEEAYATYPPNPYGLPESRGQQTFPETPNLFSPMWSAAIPGTGPGRRPRHSMDPVLLGLPPGTPMSNRTPPPPMGARPKDGTPTTGSSYGSRTSGPPQRTPPVEVPQTPLPYSPPPTAGLPGVDGRMSMSLGSDEFMPSLDQQMLLTRAASSVNRSRHERQGSLSQQGGSARPKTVAPPNGQNYPPHPYAAPELIQENDEEEGEVEGKSRSQPSWIEPNNWIEPKFPSGATSPNSEAASPSSAHPSETSASLYSQGSPTTYSAHSHRRNDSGEPVPPVPPLPVGPQYRSDIEEAASRSFSEGKGFGTRYDYSRHSFNILDSNDGDEEDSEVSHPSRIEASLRLNDMVGAGIKHSQSTATLMNGTTSPVNGSGGAVMTMADQSSTSLTSQHRESKALPDLPPASPPSASAGNISADRDTTDSQSKPIDTLSVTTIQIAQPSNSSYSTNDSSSTLRHSPSDLITPKATSPPQLAVNVPPPQLNGTSPVTAAPPALVVPPPPPLPSSVMVMLPPPTLRAQQTSIALAPFPIPERTDSLVSEPFDPDPKLRGRYPSIPSIGSSPPAYDSLFDQLTITDNLTPGPSTSGSGSGSGSASAFSSEYPVPSTNPSPMAALTHSQSVTLHRRSDSDNGQSVAERRAALRDSTSSTYSRKNRNRPGGPRRPTTQSGVPSRSRNASVSGPSTGANLGVNSGSRLRAASIPLPPGSPRFQTPALKWRGYTMEAAKWTFTSAELQQIVSGSIKWSAEASSIRLLKLQTAKTEIPEEMRKLEMQRTDIKTQYKIAARRRIDLLDSLASSVSGPSVNVRLVEELKEISLVLDRLAEDLHTTDEQIAQLKSLSDVHNASALAMAIRKLNASLIKQMAQNDELRRQLEALEGERDDAWRQAEAVAGDYDRLAVDTPNSQTGSQPQSNRSSRVMAMRKSSLRVSKAGLRSSSRVSMSSNRLSVASLSGSKSPYSTDDIPPVPPIPNRPADILTDMPKTSTTGISTEGQSPSSATRAMIRAHEELCDMLGLKLMDRRPRRSRSFGGRGDVEVKARSPSRPQSSSGRPSSLPDSSQLTEAYQVMTADRHAILATMGMLADDP